MFETKIPHSFCNPNSKNDPILASRNHKKYPNLHLSSVVVNQTTPWITNADIHTILFAMSETDPPVEETVQMEVDEKSSPDVGEVASPAAASATKKEETTDTEKNNAAATDNTPSWDHSDRRVMLQGVFKYHDSKQCRKMVQDLLDTISKTEGTPMEIDKIKKAPKQSWVSVTLMKVEMVEPFINHVNSNDILSKSGRRLFAKQADSNERKRRGDDTEDARGGKRQKGKTATVECRRAVTEAEIKNKMCPLWNLSEEEQRNQKLKEMIKKCTMKIVQGKDGMACDSCFFPYFSSANILLFVFRKKLSRSSGPFQKSNEGKFLTTIGLNKKGP